MAARKLAGLRLDVRRSLISGCTVPSLPVRVFNTEQDTAMAELSWCWQHYALGRRLLWVTTGGVFQPVSL